MHRRSWNSIVDLDIIAADFREGAPLIDGCHHRIGPFEAVLRASSGSWTWVGKHRGEGRNKDGRQRSEPRQSAAVPVCSCYLFRVCCALFAERLGLPSARMNARMFFPDNDTETGCAAPVRSGAAGMLLRSGRRQGSMPIVLTAKAWLLRSKRFGAPESWRQAARGQPGLERFCG